MSLNLTRRVSVAAAGLVLASTAVATAPAAAQDVAMPCDPGFYQVISGQLGLLDPGAQDYTPLGAPSSKYNAMAYRKADGFLYAISGQTLWRIDGNGVKTDLGTLDVVSGAYTGDFGDDGLLHISRGGRDWYAVDVDTLAATARPDLSTYAQVADITNVHGVFYGLSNGGYLWAFDPVAGTATELAAVAGLPSTAKSYGAAWATAGGNLYIGRNSGEIYQVTGYTTANPIATQVGSAPATSSNDGASCALAVPMPGLNDVDGPESESVPSTPEAQAAADAYVADWETIAATFDPSATVEPVIEPVVEEPVVEEPAVVDPVEEPAVEEPVAEETFELEDAGVGTGPSCAGGAEDRPTRDAVVSLVSVTEPTPLYTSGFDGNPLADFTILSGSWSAGNSSFDQGLVCGYDYSVLLDGQPVTDFRWEATFSAPDGNNNGGLIFHQASPYSRSGAVAVDLADNGSVIRWGQYDDRGYYQNLGAAAIASPGAGAVTVAVDVHGSQFTVFVDGVEVGSAQSTEDTGQVGLVSSLSEVHFQSVALTALPAVGS